jgi:hypothetical protein
LPNGRKEWHLHDQCHREDGPAIEDAYGNKWWYFQGKNYTEKEYWRVLKLKALW